MHTDTLNLIGVTPYDRKAYAKERARKSESLNDKSDQFKVIDGVVQYSNNKRMNHIFNLLARTIDNPLKMQSDSSDN